MRSGRFHRLAATAGMGPSQAMTTLAETVSRGVRVRIPRRVALAWTPVALTVLNAAAFLIIRPDVNDLWAARARATAVRDGVGLTYWFSWFGGGSTPGNYSVLTPLLSAYVTAEVLCALATVAIPLLCMALFRTSEHRVAATAVAALTASANLWSGRVPFLFGAAVGLGALIAVQRRKTAAAVLLSWLSILASPVTGAFLAIGLAGAYLSYKEYRRISLVTIVAIGAGLAVVGLAFGAPGPEPFSGELKLELVGGLLLLLLARPPVWVRSTIWLSVIATFVLAAFPNGLGSNFSRLVWFCLPVLVVGLSRLRLWVLMLLVMPLLVAGWHGTVVDLNNAGKPIARVAYYQPLAAQLDTITGLKNYRVEVVNHGGHAAYDALLNHALLARGWETQADNALNKAITQSTLDAITYKVWLDNNAVGYVALPAASVNSYSEYDLVALHAPSYLRLVWHTDDWKLYRVVDPTPIVAAPATIRTVSQSQLTVDVPCGCTLNVRVRWSKFLHADDQGARLSAKVLDDGAGWTTVTTPAPGVYVLHGSLSGVLS